MRIFIIYAGDRYEKQELQKHSRLDLDIEGLRNFICHYCRVQRQLRLRRQVKNNLRKYKKCMNMV